MLSKGYRDRAKKTFVDTYGASILIGGRDYILKMNIGWALDDIERLSCIRNPYHLIMQLTLASHCLKIFKCVQQKSLYAFCEVLSIGSMP